MDMQKRVRILIAIGIVIVACGAFAWFFGTQAFYMWEFHRMARKEPNLWAIPAELPDLSTSESQGKRLSYFGYEFEVPWDDIDSAQTRILSENKALIVFRSGNVISFWSSYPSELPGMALQQGQVDRKTSAALYGDDAAQSDYTFKRAILDVTPDSVSLFTPKRRAIQESFFFMVKAAIVPVWASNGVFSVSSKEFRGFQYGTPGDPSKRLSVELFSDKGHVDILFGEKPGGPVKISQADVNRVVQSVVKLPAQANKSNIKLQN
jgi:hypothetical protein